MKSGKSILSCARCSKNREDQVIGLLFLLHTSSLF